MPQIVIIACSLPDTFGVSPTRTIRAVIEHSFPNVVVVTDNEVINEPPTLKKMLESIPEINFDRIKVEPEKPKPFQYFSSRLKYPKRI